MPDIHFNIMHIVPVADSRPHDETPHCWCGPTNDEPDDGAEIWVHNAADNREEYEAVHGETIRGKPWLCVADGVPIENDPWGDQ